MALGALGEPAVAPLLDSRDRVGLGGGAVSVAVALILISILHVVLGEIVPKSYTLPRAEQVALAVAPLIGMFFFLFAWFIAFLDWLAHLVMRAGIQRPTSWRRRTARSSCACCCARVSARACSRATSNR